MDTKLKNKRKSAILLIIATILAPAFFVTNEYRDWYQDSSKMVENLNRSVFTSQQFLKNFIDVGYILYNTESAREEVPDNAKEILDNNFHEEMEEFESLYPFLDYRVEDEKGKVVAKSTANSERSVTESNLSDFAIGIVVEYDAYGNPDARIEQSKSKAEQSIELRKIISDYDEQYWECEIYNEGEETWETYTLEKPKNRTYIYAMTDENLQTYLDNDYYVGYIAPDEIINIVTLMILAVAVAALVYPVMPSWSIGREKVFQMPFEIVIGVFGTVIVVLFNNLGWLLERQEGTADMLDFGVWVAVFSVTYWAATCLRGVYTLGIRTYVKERTLLCHYWKYIIRVWDWMRKEVRAAAATVRGWLGKGYHSLENIDLREKSNAAILKIVLCNFVIVILVLVCFMWAFGIMALVVYSVILFFILRKYSNDLQEKYAILLKATGEIAEGNLEAEITEDLGVFNPFKTEMQKIQKGFKKAVDEEVKSQRMKTELITNVSHDLKTPLTAIITYVNLLKEEKEEEKRKDYIEVLERKSLRLKVLIEDLFEISKASSKNVTLNIMDVDVVNLFKQVKLEMEDKITEAGLDFRCTYPEGKVIAPLDSQKTYRVFENLLINIIKYAMPHTRVYIEIVKEGQKTVVRMKNVSAAELNFNPEEITERFVRGDASRNTEGSGLGLAIAKSFVELQKGKFKIETEADLFKVEIRW